MKNIAFNKKMSKLMINAWMVMRLHQISISSAMKMVWRAFLLRQKGLHGTVEFDYIKKSTGEIRHAIGTFDLNAMPESACNFKGNASYTPMQIRYFDIEKQAWRSCLAENIIAVY